MKGQGIAFPLLSLLLISACATKPRVSEHSDEVPAWVYTPSEGCDEGAELCASGEGPNNSVADANAMKGLASIFEVRITGATSQLLTMSNDAVLRQSQETASASVKEEVDQTLKAASIKRRHRHKNLSYSLAALDKAKASDNIRSAMDTAQAELDGLWQRKDRTGWARMWELLLTRDSLNDRYALIMGGRMTYAPSADQLQKWYQSRKLTRSIGWEGQDLPEALAGSLKGRLTEAGMALTKSSEGERIRATFEAKQGFIKVTGFERWEFVLTVEHLDAGDKKLGTLSVNASATGRSRADCETKTRTTLMKAVDDGLTQLNLND